jgi:hypothetical protein
MNEAAAQDAVALLFRHVLQQRMLEVFPRGARLLDLLGDVDAEDGVFDGAYAGTPGLDGADPAALAAVLERALRPGSPVVLTLPGPRPLPRMLRRALSGEGDRPVARPTVAELRLAFGARFEWSRSFALGVLVPPPGDTWVRDHPQAFGVLAAAERSVRARPLFRALGERIVLEGRLR